MNRLPSFCKRAAAVILTLGLWFGDAAAQTFTTLRTLSTSEGTQLVGLMQASDGNFYGTAQQGGSTAGPGQIGLGSVFKMTPPGLVTVLHSFGTVAGDGGFPSGSLAEGPNGNLYGTTTSPNGGTVFMVTPGGTFTTLYAINGQLGTNATPVGRLLHAADGNFYGVSYLGGTNGRGCVFKITTNGTAAGTTFTTIYSFSTSPNSVNADGMLPGAGLTQGSDGNLYGTTVSGGSFGRGTVFKITPAGILTSLHSLQNNVGSEPYGELVEGSPGIFYGTTTSAGGGSGAVYRIITDGSAAGTQAERLYAFISPTDGGGTHAPVALDSDGNLYGATDIGPGNASGIFFRLTPSGSFTNLYTFGNKTGEAQPHYRVLTANDGKIYGTTASTLYRFTPATAAPTPTPTPAPTAPPHGGLSNTLFTVNGSASLSANVADTVLRFAAQQAGRPAQLVCRVQWSVTPNNEASWKELPDGTDGHMSYDKSSDQFVLNSTSYPLMNGVFFRVIASAQGYPDSVSNVIGGTTGFALATNKAHLTKPDLYLLPNGPFSDLSFRAKQRSLPGGTAVRVQTSTTPSVETSWTDLANGNSGHMTQGDASNPNVFLLEVNDYPAGTGVYFRAVAAAPQYVDGLSRPLGPFNIERDIPPSVTIELPSGYGAGTAADPRVVIAGQLNFSAKATLPNDRKITSLTLQMDTKTLTPPSGEGFGSLTVDYTTSTISPTLHVIEAIAIDERGGTARAGTDPKYLLVLPGPNDATSSKAMRANEGNPTASASMIGRVFTLIGDGFWSDASIWSANDHIGGVPGAFDTALIGGNHFVIAVDTQIGSVVLNGGEILGFENQEPSVLGNLIVYESLLVVSGSLQDLFLNITSTASCLFVNTDDISFTGRVVNYGDFILKGSGGLRGLTNYRGLGTTNFKLPLTVPVSPAPRILEAKVYNMTSGILRGPKLAIDAAQTLLGRNTYGGAVLISHDGGSVISNDGGSVISNDGGSLISQDGGGILGEDSSGLISNDGGGIITDNGTGFTGARSKGNAVELSSSTQAATATAGFIQDGGETDLSGVTIMSDVVLNGGLITGSGLIGGNLTNNGGYISPGRSPGGIGIAGSFIQGPGGVLVLEIGGRAPTQFDQLLVTDAASLNGKLIVHTINGYIADLADTFSPLGYSSVSGSFASVSANTGIAFKSTGALLTTNPSIASPIDSALRNISTRARIETGDNVMIGGFIITGSTTKRVIIRAVGPSLPLGGTLSDPVLELHQGDGTVITNDNWRSDQEQEIIATNIAPPNNLESAIIATLPPGGHTAIVRGKNGGAGIGLIEVYELDSSSTAAFANISTRARVQTGDNVLIGGIIVGGTEPASVVIRALGPSLAAAGVGGVLADPMLEVHDGNGNAFLNDNWLETQEADIAAANLQPGDQRESGILINLLPGAYTAIVRGKDNGSGVALVEAYKIK